MNHNNMRGMKSNPLAPQASASTNSATRAQMSFLDGVSQEMSVQSSANDNDEKLPTKKNRTRLRAVVAGNQNEMQTCGVYFLATANGKRVKIGKSRHISGRVVDIANMNANGLNLLVVVPGGYTSTEAWFHRTFVAQRLHGEWFTIDDSIRSMVKQLRAGSVPASVLAEVERDDDAERDRIKQESASARRVYAPLPVQPRISKQTFGSVDEIVKHWKAAGGPTFGHMVDLDLGETSKHKIPLSLEWKHERGDKFFPTLGFWIDKTDRVLEDRDFYYRGPAGLAHAMVVSTPAHRLYDLIAASMNEFSCNDRVRSHGDARHETSRLVHAARTGGQLGHGRTKRWLPGSWDCLDKCTVCRKWPDNGSPDALEELRRVAHCADVATRGWSLGVLPMDLHYRGCDCFCCQPNHSDHKTA